MRKALQSRKGVLAAEGSQKADYAAAHLQQPQYLLRCIAACPRGFCCAACLQRCSCTDTVSGKALSSQRNGICHEPLQRHALPAQHLRGQRTSPSRASIKPTRHGARKEEVQGAGSLHPRLRRRAHHAAASAAELLGTIAAQTAPAPCKHTCCEGVLGADRVSRQIHAETARSFKLSGACEATLYLEADSGRNSGRG